MSIATPHRHILIDFENVPGIDLTRLAGMAAGVTLFAGAKQRAMDVDLAAQLLECSPLVQLVRIRASGRNALDLTLAFYLGKAVTENPRAEFFIISGDKDYDAVIKQVTGHGVRVSRHGSVADLPFLAKLAPQLKSAPADDLYRTYAQKLRKGPFPATLSALRKKIQNDLKKHLGPDGVDAVVEWLKKESVVELGPDEKVKVMPTPRGADPASSARSAPPSLSR